jgi:hypothetical protein
MSQQQLHYQPTFPQPGKGRPVTTLPALAWKLYLKSLQQKPLRTKVGRAVGFAVPAVAVAPAPGGQLRAQASAGASSLTTARGPAGAHLRGHRLPVGCHCPEPHPAHALQMAAHRAARAAGRPVERAQRPLLAGGCAADTPAPAGARSTHTAAPAGARSTLTCPRRQPAAALLPDPPAARRCTNTRCPALPCPADPPCRK